MRNASPSTSRRSKNPVPVIEVSGRTYPVDIVYRSLVPEDDEPEIDAVSGVRLAVQECARRGSGDMLVFLPTERDIHEAVKLLEVDEDPRRFAGARDGDSAAVRPSSRANASSRSSNRAASAASSWPRTSPSPR